MLFLKKIFDIGNKQNPFCFKSYFSGLFILIPLLVITIIGGKYGIIIKVSIRIISFIGGVTGAIIGAIIIGGPVLLALFYRAHANRLLKKASEIQNGRRDNTSQSQGAESRETQKDS